MVRYKQEFDRYLKEKGYNDIKALVAFSGTVLLDGVPPEYTEPNMNGFGEKEFEQIGHWIADVLQNSEFQEKIVREKVKDLCQAFPIYS